MLYPLKFHPIFKEKIWGGKKIRTVLNKKDAPGEKCGESWEISGVHNNISVVCNGILENNNLEELIEIYMGDLVGDQVYEKFGLSFPLLIKFIDAKKILSLQVHPDDKLAWERHNEFGKTEMWYIIDAEPKAQLISGFTRDLDKNQFVDLFNKGKINEVLNKINVKKGDSFFIPAGRIHATGAGILFAEIQQTSDITYRVYDWDRKDNSGKSRELHVEMAFDAIDYKHYNNYRNKYKKLINQTNHLISCDYFTTNYIHFNQKISFDYNKLDSFVIYICLEGKFEIFYNKKEPIKIFAGESVLIPATLDEILLNPINEAKIIEVYYIA